MDHFEIVFTGMTTFEIIMCVAMVLFVSGHVYACIAGAPDFNVLTRSILIGAFFVIAVLTSVIDISAAEPNLYSTLSEVVKEALKYLSVLMTLLHSFNSIIKFYGD